MVILIVRMARRQEMRVGHLKKCDLEFEMRLSGLPIRDKSVRNQLRPLLILKRAGRLVSYPPFEFVFDVEIPLIETRYKELLVEIRDLENPGAIAQIYVWQGIFENFAFIGAY